MLTFPVIQRYIWLVNTIARFDGRLTFGEISRKWAESSLNDGSPLSRTTFYRYREGIRELFGIALECDTSRGHVYYVAQDNCDGRLQTWLLDTLGIANMVNESRSLSWRIFPEHSPSAGPKLMSAVDAMHAGMVLVMTYVGFNPHNVPATFRVKPYAVKQCIGRWYLIGVGEDGKLRPYAFDRIRELLPTQEHFTYPAGLDVDEEFVHSVGVMTDEAPERVVIRVYDGQANYIRSLPLHHSQEEVEGEADTFALYVRPTVDFIMKLRSYGPAIEVVAPRWLREQLVAEARMTENRNS